MLDMLNSLKKNLNRRSIVAYLIFGAIILVFVFFGFRTTDDQQMGYAARVNNKLISISEYKVALDRVTYFSKMFGAGNSPDSEARNRVDALNQIIQLELISQGASQAGLSVTNPEIADKIMSDSTFKKDGVFQRDMYERALSYERLSTTNYEDRLKKSLLYKKAYNLFENLVFASDFEIKKAQSLDKFMVNLEFLKLDGDSGKIEEIEKLYDGNPKAAVEIATGMGLKWAETGFFNLSAQEIPKIGTSNDLIIHAFKAQNKGDLLKRIFNVSYSKYIVRLKDKKSDSKLENEEKVSKNLTSLRAQGLFQMWMQDLAQQTTIERNPAIIKISAD